MAAHIKIIPETLDVGAETAEWLTYGCNVKSVLWWKILGVELSLCLSIQSVFSHNIKTNFIW